MRYEDLNIEMIQDEGLTPLDPERIAAIAKSIEEVGLINPVTVQRREGMPFVVAGRHRLAAMARLGWHEAPCIIIQPSDDVRKPTVEAQLAEIDENLVRADLTPAQREALIARRKELYEQKNPETKPTKEGGAGRRKATRRQNGDDTPDRFTKEVSKLTGKSERSVQRSATRGKKLKTVLPRVVKTSLDKGTELDALAKLPDDKRDEVVAKAEAGETVSAVEVLAQCKPPEPAPETKQEAVGPDSNIVALSSLPTPAPAPDQEPAAQQPVAATAAHVRALDILREVKRIDVSVVEMVPPREQLVFAAAVHEAALRLDELKDALP